MPRLPYGEEDYLHCEQESLRKLQELRQRSAQALQKLDQEAMDPEVQEKVGKLKIEPTRDTR